MRDLCIIPARGGSKRIPRKNIRPFAGRPIIAYSIEAALESGLFSEVIVSTDDEEIADIARGLGASVPFMRPAELAGDLAGTTEVITHATAWMQTRHGAFDAVCCLYPAAPFVLADDLRRARKILDTGPWDYAFTATDFASPILRSFKLMPEGGVEMFFPETSVLRSQDMPPAFHDAAQFYWGRPAAWLGGHELFAPRSYAMVIPRWRVQDIDTAEDWKRAELIYVYLHASQPLAGTAPAGDLISSDHP